MWAQLVRLPNVFTVLADVSAAFLLVHHGPAPIIRFILVALAGVALYWAGMILNDVFDVDQDRVQRPQRPIPAGLISLGASQNRWLATLDGRHRNCCDFWTRAERWCTYHMATSIGRNCLGSHDYRLRWSPQENTARAGCDGKLVEF